jgi:hypothetical protein
MIPSDFYLRSIRGCSGCWDLRRMKETGKIMTFFPSPVMSILTGKRRHFLPESGRLSPGFRCLPAGKIRPDGGIYLPGSASRVFPAIKHPFIRAVTRIFKKYPVIPAIFRRVFTGSRLSGRCDHISVKWRPDTGYSGPMEMHSAPDVISGQGKTRLIPPGPLKVPGTIFSLSDRLCLPLLPPGYSRLLSTFYFG